MVANSMGLVGRKFVIFVVDCLLAYSVQVIRIRNSYKNVSGHVRPVELAFYRVVHVSLYGDLPTRNSGIGVV